MSGPQRRCWCGNTDLDGFSAQYLFCPVCHSLCLAAEPRDLVHVTDSQGELYGKDYYIKHLPNRYGYPDLEGRTRLDLPERCLYWLRTLLKYIVPPADLLELGSAHGGFVALLRWAGFNATGLELSPWLVDFAREKFSVSMLLGPVETQAIAPGSLDVIALMDVLEHLVDPVATMSHCRELLKPDGIFLIQTPCFPSDKNLEAMKSDNDPFLLQLKEEEHLHLFSKRAVVEFFRRLSVEHVVFEPAIFAHYDMCVIAGRMPFEMRAPEEAEKALAVHPGGRLVQALVDLDDMRRSIIKKLEESEADRAARLDVIERQAKEFSEKISEKIEELKSSMSWRVTSPFRWVFDKWNTINGRASSKIAAGVASNKMSDYVYRPETRDEDFEEGVQLLRKKYKVMDGWVDHNAPQVVNTVHKYFIKQGIPVNEWHVNVEEYNTYFEKAAYKDLYPNYYPDYLSEKSFEHFITFRLLDIKPNEVFIDIASENSPVPEIYSRLTGCKSYRQDIMYRSGFVGDRIGGDACQMPVPDQFLHKVTLTGSLEHFEGDGDQRLFLELSRILKPGGKVCVVPLFVYTSPANQIEPAVSIPNNVPLDNKATIYCAIGWGNRFARFYSPVSFVKRIFNPTKELFGFEVFRIMNAEEVHPDIYARFALVATRKG